MSRPALRTAGLGFRYGGAERDAFADVSLTLEAGQVALIVGPSGSGKSTLARVLAGLIPRDVPGELTGELEVGHEADGGLGSDVGIVFQDPGSQLVMERVDDDVAFGLENRGVDPAIMRERVPATLAEVGLEGFEARRTTRLSGGEQQRLAIADALAPEPGVLVLDEPTANLDPAGTAAVFDRVRGLADRRSTAIVLVEHRVELAWPLADVVLALGPDGRPLDLGPAQAVLERSRTALEAAGIWLPAAPGRRRRAGPRRRASRGAGPSVLRIDQAWFGFPLGQPTIHGVTLDVAVGERVALVGPNGSGKTTLLRLAIGLLRPRAGLVTILGRDPTRLSGRELARQVGYVVQDPELGFMANTVADEVALGLTAAERDHATELAARLDLDIERFGERSPYLLSGGEQRRLSLVTALARRPRLLVLDEPTFGQDRLGFDALVAALDDLVGSGTAVLAATHDDRFVEAFADRVVRLDDGYLEP